MGEIPNELPPLAVPAGPAAAGAPQPGLGMPAPPGVPRLGAMRAPRWVEPPPVDRGREVPFEELVPGTHYYLQSSEAYPLEEIIFVQFLPHHSFGARYLPPLRQFRNREGNPMVPVYEPQAPVAHPDAVYERHAWPHYKFFEVSKIKRTGRFINPTILTRAKRQAVMNSMSKKGLPSVVGTGPANLVLGFAGLKPPRRTRGGKRKHRKTRKQRRT